MSKLAGVIYESHQSTFRKKGTNTLLCNVTVRAKITPNAIDLTTVTESDIEDFVSVHMPTAVPAILKKMTEEGKHLQHITRWSLETVPV